jgi:hypothetical protein
VGRAVVRSRGGATNPRKRVAAPGGNPFGHVRGGDEPQDTRSDGTAVATGGRTLITGIVWLVDVNHAGTCSSAAWNAGVPWSFRVRADHANSGAQFCTAL